jgi:hypothetical protein
MEVSSSGTYEFNLAQTIDSFYFDSKSVSGNVAGAELFINTNGSVTNTGDGNWTSKLSATDSGFPADVNWSGSDIAVGNDKAIKSGEVLRFEFDNEGSGGGYFGQNDLCKFHDQTTRRTVKQRELGGLLYQR